MEATQIPKYEYWLLQVRRHSYYSKELAQEMSNQIASMTAQGWQVEGPHQMLTTSGSDLIISQMMRRYHPLALEHDQKKNALKLIPSTTQEVVVA